MPELPPIEQRLVAILKRTAEFSRPCKAKGCHVPIHFLRQNKDHGGALIPYDEQGMNHFATCPHADQFRKARAKAAGGTA